MTEKRYDRWIAIAGWLCFAISVCLYLRVVFASGFDHDEMEHALVVKRLSDGLLPYRDFPQNHFPLLWAISAPLVYLFASATWYMLSLRLFQLLPILVLMAVMLRHVAMHKFSVRVPLCLAFLFPLFFYTEWYRFRPDPWAVGLMVLAMATLVKAPRRGFVTGVCIATSMLFTPKLFPLLLIAPGYACLVARDTTARTGLLWFTKVTAGVIVPTMLFYASLVYLGLASDFYRECIEFNQVPAWDYMELVYAFKQTIFLATLIITAWLIARISHFNWRELPAVSLAGSGILYLFLRTPFHASPYQFQGVVGLIGVFMVTVKSKAPRLNLLALGVGLLVAALSWQSVSDMIALRGPGTSILQDDLTWLGENIQPQDSCFGLTPFHPIYCSQVGTLDRGWDLIFLHHPNEKFRRLQQQHIESNLSLVTNVQPKFVIAGYRWFSAMNDIFKSPDINEQIRMKFTRLLESNYERRFSPQGMLVYRKKDLQ